MLVTLLTLILWWEQIKLGLIVILCLFSTCVLILPFLSKSP